MRFADGSTISTGSGHGGHNLHPLHDGIPAGPILLDSARGSEATLNETTIVAYRAVWLSPLPPLGEIKLMCRWPVLGLEGTCLLDGTDLANAAGRARTFWAT